MTTRAFAVILLCGVSVSAQSKLTAPLAGIARDSAGQLRLVDGVTGNFVLRDAIGSGVLDWVFDGTSGLVTTETQLWKLGPSGAILQRLPGIGADTVLGPESAFFLETAELWQIGPKSNSKVSIEPAALAGRVIAIGPAKAQLTPFAVCRANQLWLLSINTATGAVAQESAQAGAIAEQACLPAGGSLILLADRMLLATAQSILVQTSAGEERSIAVSASHASRAGAHWVEMQSARGPSHMIRITSDGEQVYQLPAAKEQP